MLIPVGNMQQWQALRRRLDKREDGSAAGLVKLLREARRDVRQRLVALPQGTPITQARTAAAGITNATQALNGRMRSLFQTDAEEAIRIGGEMGWIGGPELGHLYGIDPRQLERLYDYHADLIGDVTDSLRAQLTKRIKIGLLAGRSVEDIARELAAARSRGGKSLQALGPFLSAETRAEAIARTECNRVANMAGLYRMEAAVRVDTTVRKRWVTNLDGRERDSHQAAHGQTVKIGQLFVVGGHKCKHPVDPALPAAEAVRCRCGMRLVREDTP
jgi:hypothetical protein